MSEAVLEISNGQPEQGPEEDSTAPKIVTAEDVDKMSIGESHDYIAGLPEDQQERVMNGLDAIPVEDTEGEPSDKDSGDLTPEPGTEGDKTEKPSDKDSGDPDKKPDEKLEEFTGIKIGENVYANQDAANAALLEAQQFIGKQANELGDLRQRVPKEAPADDPEPEHDPYDKEKHSAWLAWNNRKMIRENQVQAVESQQLEAVQTANANLEKFISENGSLPLDKMVAVNNLVLEKGITLDAALAEIQNINSPDTNHDPTKKPGAEIIKKQDVAAKVPDTLAGGGGGGGAEVDVSSMTGKQLHDYRKTLTPEQDMRFMNGEDI